MENTLGIGFIIFISIEIGSLGCLIWFLLIKKEVAERRVKRLINKETIAGNEVAIAIFKKDSLYFNGRNEDLIIEALKGNKSAIKALDLKHYLKD